MASMKRKITTTEEELPLAKKLTNISSDESSSSVDNLRVVLNSADCDLAFNIGADGLRGDALYEQGFAYCWSGARGNIGITGGKYCFGCKIVASQPVEMEDTPLDLQHVCRVGISRGDDLVGNLGETEHSFGYGGTRKFSTAGRYVDYGEKFGVGDTIVCLVDLESKPFASLEFSKNGKRLGIAKRFDAGSKGFGVIDSPAEFLPWKSAIFPHVLLKNTVVEMQFSVEDGLIPEEGYSPWASAVKDGNFVRGPAFSDPKDCEVIMMVGLPASGKTYWAENWVKEHPEKRYILLGTNLALDQMKVPGLLRKFNYGERFDRLMDRATGIFNTLLSRASKVPRNYIIDQTNVYKSARRRKLKPFISFHKTAVVVFPRQEQLKVRARKRFEEMGKEVPSEAVNQMLENFVLPGTDEDFDEVIFTDLSRDEAQHHLYEMKRGLSLSSSVKLESDHPLNSRETSVLSDSRMSAHSLADPGHTYSGYSSPSLGLQTGAGSWIDHPSPALQPYSAEVNRGYNGAGQPVAYSFNANNRYEGSGYYGRSDLPARSYPYQGSLNPMAPSSGYPGPYPSYSNPVPGRDRGFPGSNASYGNPVPRENLFQYESHTHDLHARHESYGLPGYGNYAEDTRPAYQPPHAVVSPYGTPFPRPSGSYPAHLLQPRTAPYLPPRYY